MSFGDNVRAHLLKLFRCLHHILIGQLKLSGFKICQISPNRRNRVAHKRASIYAHVVFDRQRNKFLLVYRSLNSLKWMSAINSHFPKPKEGTENNEKPNTRVYSEV